MYLLTPGQAFVVGTIFLIIFLFKAIGIGLGNAAGKYHVCPRAFEYGYPEPYCQAMIDRQMRFYLGEWIPLYDVNDKESEELKAKLSILLSSQSTGRRRTGPALTFLPGLREPRTTAPP